VPDYLAARTRGETGVEMRFHEELLLRNGVYRTTRANRMDETFPPLLAACASLARRPLRVLDVACSVGISTVELHQALVGAGLSCATVGTDYIVAARYVARADGCGLLFDGDEQVLQVDVDGWASPWRWRRSDRLLRAGLVTRAKRLLVRETASFRAALRGAAPGFTVREVPLLARATEGVPGLSFAQESILEPRVPGPFDVIRAANILNGDYFPPAQLRRMVELLRERLEHGGVLLVARNLPGETLTRSTIFRHANGRLVPEAETHGGSEVAALLRG
jgi:hypothetical protein